MHEAIDLTGSFIGFLVLAIFVAGYYFIASEEKYHINKAKPALFIGTFIFIVIGIYTTMTGGDSHRLEEHVHHIILEIVQIFFFLFVAMTFIETMIEREVFESLKYKLVSKGYDYKKLFWITGVLAFFISPVADNLTTALILSTVLITIERENKDFLVAGAINIVVAANAGGAWSPFGDITTLMAWVAGKGTFFDFFWLLPASIVGWLITGWLLSMGVPEGKPHFDASTMYPVSIKPGGKMVIYLGAFTIFSAVMCHQVLHIPAMWGMMFGLSLLKLFSYYMKKRLQLSSGEAFDVFHSMKNIETDTLLFFFGILAAVGGLHYLGYLDLFGQLYGIIGPTATNIGVGLVSAVVDNVPVMSAVLKSNPMVDGVQMGLDQWLLVTLTAGIGGSLISFGSAAGVGVMGKLRGVYTFGAHMKQAWKVMVGYVLSIGVWYVQFQILGLY